MGGSALKGLGIETRRVSTEELYSIFAEISKTLKDKLGLETYMGEFYRSKPDHGDVDVLFKVDNTFYNKSVNMTKWIKENFDTKGVFHNGSVNSFEYKDFQVDLIPVAESNWEIAKVWFSYDPIPNLAGKISYRMGVKFGPDGFRFMYRTEEGSEYGEILLTKDPKKIYEFLDFDYSKIEKGFDTLEDIYAFMISSKYFSADIYQYDNLRHIDRKRNLRRKSYGEFLAFINNNLDKLPNYVYHEDKTLYIPLLAESFPEANLYEKIEEMKEKERIHKEISSKFNGHLIMERHPELKGKELGNMMFNFKAKFANFNEYCLSHTMEEIMNKFSKDYDICKESKILTSERDAEVFFNAILDESAEPNDALKEAVRRHKEEIEDDEQNIGDIFKSEEFQKAFEERVKKDTWGKGLPMIYAKDGKIVKHWKDGTIEIIKDLDK